ncbi:high affinity choline transporter, putative, partial [Ixodes scapularis]
SICPGGYFFANKMRAEGYVTMLDPFQDLLGGRMGGLLFIPALCGEVFWSAAILAALGATVGVIIDIDTNTSIIASACIALFYTFFGGLYSVAYTDVIQLFLIFVGLPWRTAQLFKWLADSFIWQMTRFVSTHLRNLQDPIFLLKISLKLIQSFKPGLFAKLLSQPNVRTVARVRLHRHVPPASTLGCCATISRLHPAFEEARGAGWNETEFTGPLPLDKEHTSLVLPMVLQFLTPGFVSFVGLGAVSAAVMSSSDSSILSAASMFARNVYKLIFRQNASEREVIWVMRVAILFVGAMATAMALTVKSIYGLWYLSSDLVYVILFPQLVSVVYMKQHCNTYGSLGAYIIGLLLRGLGGEDILGLPAVIRYPFYNEVDGQLFPFRTLAMLVSLASIVSISTSLKWAFESGRIPARFDIFHCIVNIPEDVIKVQEPQEGEMTVLNACGLKSYQTEMNGRVNPALN